MTGDVLRRRWRRSCLDRPVCLICCPILLLLILSGCGADRPGNRVGLGARTVIIEGEIVNVLETWPLQLVVQAAGQSYDVRLLENTRIVRNEREVGAGELRPATKVEIFGEAEGTALTAQSITIK